ncbi:Glycosyltransferase family 2 protein [Rhodovastum atsumiense]|nr:glycosyltransferase family 2 protein [Rhodovastum atsumiense]CAH2604138.1 Glycosyltransferase family 2 protein [Rhodovastum atsumiense]
MQSPPSPAARAAVGPCVSVILPARNAVDTIDRAVGSVLRQSLTDLEVIAWDDGSDDATGGLLREIARGERRLRVFGGREPVGIPAACNRALSLARGRWVTVLDAEDWLGGDRLERMIQIGNEQQADIVLDNQFLCDAVTGQPMGTVLRPADQVRALPLRTFLRKSMPRSSGFDYGLLKPVIRRNFLQANNIWCNATCQDGYGFVLLLDCFMAGARVLLSNRPGYYRMQPPPGMPARHPRYDYAAMKLWNDQMVAQYMDILSEEERDLLVQRGASLDRCARLFQMPPTRQDATRTDPASLPPSRWPSALRALMRRMGNC